MSQPTERASERQVLDGRLVEHVRDIAAARLGARPTLDAPLAPFGDITICMLLIDLEEAFRIALDVDEVLPDGRFAELLALVDRRVDQLARARQIATDCGQLIDFTAERARRARSVVEACARRNDALDQVLNAHRAASLDTSAARIGEFGRRLEALAEPVAPQPPPIAVPSDEAWRLAAKLYTRERRTRLILLFVALACVAGMVGGIALFISEVLH